MADFIDLTGRELGKWTVLSRSPKRPGGHWLCKCECGVEKVVTGQSLRSGTSKSCGHDNKAQHLPAILTKHGHKTSTHRTRTYVSWEAMKQRCLNPRYRFYHNYGGRGIGVCERWLQFTAFLEDMGERPPDTSLERVNNEGSYGPGNCRWATRIEQNRNTRWCRITAEVAATVKELRTRHGLTHAAIAARVGISSSSVSLILHDKIKGLNRS